MAALVQLFCLFFQCFSLVLRVMTCSQVKQNILYCCNGSPHLIPFASICFKNSFNGKQEEAQIHWSTKRFVENMRMYFTCIYYMHEVLLFAF